MDYEKFDLQDKLGLRSENKHELEESISDTILKDLKLIAIKTRYAVLPFTSSDKIEAMRDCRFKMNQGTYGDH